MVTHHCVSCHGMLPPVVPIVLLLVIPWPPDTAAGIVTSLVLACPCGKEGLGLICGACTQKLMSEKIKNEWMTYPYY